jgi:DNA replication and repair protein RecF
VLVGTNGQGKTNLLEAVYLLATHKPHRASRLAELVRFGAERGLVSASVTGPGGERRISVEVAPGGRTAFLDGKPVDRPEAYLEGHRRVFHAGRPAPREPGVRRGSSTAPLSIVAGGAVRAREYPKTFASKPPCGARRRRWRELSRAAGPPGRAAVPPPGAGGGAGAAFADAFAGYQGRARWRGSPTGLRACLRGDEARSGGDSPRSWRFGWSATGYGLHLGRAHMDDLTGARRPGRASTDRRAAAGAGAALKIAEIENLRSALGRPPLLLLDDVSSELDPTKNRYLLAYLAALPAQAFLTTTDRRLIEPAAGPDTAFYKVEGGAITPLLS